MMSSSSKSVPVSFLKNPIHLLAFGFGSGLSPKAPGTFGTIAAIPLGFMLFQLPLLWVYIFIALAFVAGIYICDVASKDLGVHDHSGIVWDEFVGYWIVLLAAPTGWLGVVLAFLLFRLFDIWKPSPISWLDKKVHGGFGIMLDDVAAAIYAVLVLLLVRHFVGF